MTSSAAGSPSALRLAVLDLVLAVHGERPLPPPNDHPHDYLAGPPAPGRASVAWPVLNAMRTLKESGFWIGWDRASVSDAELLALVLNNAEAARHVLDLAGGLTGLPLLTVRQLRTVPGIGEAGAQCLHAAIELNRRIALHGLCQPQIMNPAAVAALFLHEMAQLDQEQLRVVLLNTKQYVLKVETLYVGTVNCATVRVAEVFKAAIRLNAAAVIVVHNHPSGDPEPSPEDVALTRQLVEAGRLLDVDLVDHLIIGQGRWVSLRERGLGFTRER